MEVTHISGDESISDAQSPWWFRRAPYYFVDGMKGAEDSPRSHLSMTYDGIILHPYIGIWLRRVTNSLSSLEAYVFGDKTAFTMETGCDGG